MKMKREKIVKSKEKKNGATSILKITKIFFLYFFIFSSFVFSISIFNCIKVCNFRKWNLLLFALWWLSAQPPRAAQPVATRVHFFFFACRGQHASMMWNWNYFGSSEHCCHVSHNITFWFVVDNLLDMRAVEDERKFQRLWQQYFDCPCVDS